MQLRTRLQGRVGGTRESHEKGGMGGCKRRLALGDRVGVWALGTKKGS